MYSNIIKSAEIKKQFKNVSDILNIIPPEVIEKFAVSTNVDYHVKLLHGGVVFNTLLHLLLTESKLSQRAAHEMLNDTTQLIPLPQGAKRSVRNHSSICKRLQHINVDFFKRIYETVRSYVTTVSDPIQLLKLHIVAVDSTIIAETCNKLEQGFHIGNKFKKGDQRNNLYLVDLGLQGSSVMEQLSGQKEGEKDQRVNFLVRLSDKRRVSVIEQLKIPTSEYRTPDGKLVRIPEYDRVRIYSSASSVPDPAIYLHTKAEVFDIKDDGNLNSPRIVNLLTDVDGLSAVDMLEAYRYRWMVEVFFKFIKQNLDFSHLLSTSANGLKVMMYMTMIAAMMVLLYAKSNELGFRSAKFVFDLKLNNLIIAQRIILSRGDPREFMTRYNLKLPLWSSTRLPPLKENLR